MLFLYECEERDASESMTECDFIPHTHTPSGSNLTVSNSTSGTSVVELITFAAFSWGSVASFVCVGCLLSFLTFQRCKQFLMNNVTLKIHLEGFSQVIDLNKVLAIANSVNNSLELSCIIF